MAFTLRLTDDEQIQLDVIQERLQCTTRAATLKRMIDLWVDMANESLVFQNALLESSAECSRLDADLFKISSALQLAFDYRKSRDKDKPF